MKVRSLLAVFVFATLFTTVISAATPDPARTRSYIDHAWSTLSRSMSECRAFATPMTKTRPVAYLPWHMPEPASLAATARKCGVDVRELPSPIHQIGDLDPTKLPVQGVLYLPHPYVVPGGMFNEMYGWDSYFIMLGLLADHHEALARGMVDNALFEVEHYGGVLNANRTYYLTRSQPPFLSAMMAALMDDPASFPDAATRRAWLEKAYPLAVRNYEIWTRKQHRAGNTGLARYFGYGKGPVLESDNSDYYRGVIRWLLAHPSRDPGYLIKAPEHPDAAQQAALAKSSCDIATSKVCAGDWLDGYRLTADYYLGDRAMRESGFDTDFHFGPYGGSTEDYAPTGLNSLLYRYERDLESFARQLGKQQDAERWAHAAEKRRTAIDKYLWHADKGMYLDYDFVTGKASTDPYLTMFYPLWAGAASPKQAKTVRAQLHLFDYRGGLAMSTRVTGAQWDKPYGWAPTNWLASDGLYKSGFRKDARQVACQFTATIDRSFAKDGTIREKYNMVQGNADVDITAGYKQNVVGFGWTNGVYLKMRQLIDANAGHDRRGAAAGCDGIGEKQSAVAVH
jgi:alpha,alpha-trehalase